MDVNSCTIAHTRFCSPTVAGTYNLPGHPSEGTKMADTQVTCGYIILLWIGKHTACGVIGGNIRGTINHIHLHVGVRTVS